MAIMRKITHTPVDRERRAASARDYFQAAPQNQEYFMPTTVILHGYSDNRESFAPLAAYLKEKHISTVSVYLGDYVSLEDSVTIQDLAKGFAKALEENKIKTGRGDLDLIVHSTGSLVVREWLTRYYLEAGLDCPLGHYLMLAPANFGSPIASLGKTMVGRILKGWNSGFQSGREVLNALELASPYSRELARRDTFGARSFYDPSICMTAVLVGSKPYQTGLRKVVDRNGGDGTVYVSTANLNTSGLTLEFGPEHMPVVVKPWPSTAKPIAFGVLPDRDHASITRPDVGKSNLGKMIVDFLSLSTSVEYARFSAACEKLTAQTLPPNPREDIYHTYQNIVSKVTDDLGFPVKDYFLEFYEKAKSVADKEKIDPLMVKIHKEILEDVHTCDQDSSYRSLFFDLTDLEDALATGKKLMFSVSAAPLSPLISYSAGEENDVGELAVSGVAGNIFWRANQTLFVDIVIHRQQAQKVFQLF
jgi:hypothetical protein